MPLRDHFRPPTSNLGSWEAVHAQWPAVIVQQLGRVLPKQFIAEPRVHLGAFVEVDIATFDRPSDRYREDAYRETAGGVALAPAWAPALPSRAFQTELADFDEYEVRIFDQERDRRLVAAIEIISPRNKDRPESRNQFVAKCAALLRQEVSVVLVDLVTTRGANLYASLLELVGRATANPDPEASAIYAVALRWRHRARGRWLEAWEQPLAVEKSLPTLPLWLSEELAIPLDLEASYEQTCRDLRLA